MTRTTGSHSVVSGSGHQRHLADLPEAEALTTDQASGAIFGLSLWSLVLAGRAAVEGSYGVTERINRRATSGLPIGAPDAPREASTAAPSGP